MSKPNCIMVLGPTACGKTALAVALAKKIGGAVFSLDSRQVYKKLDIGTGKDLQEYISNEVPYYIIDLAEPGENYNLSRFLSDFEKAWKDANSKKLFPILCGGTGLYFNALLNDFEYISIPKNFALRKTLETISDLDLQAAFEKYRNRFPQTDIYNTRRVIRAIEIGEYLEHNILPPKADFPSLKPYTIGLDISRDERRKRISERLETRLKLGLIDEVKDLLEQGVSAGWLQSLGLEYKYITQYLLGQYSETEMKSELETAIHQFAKRQMTWFRKLEKEGLDIHWHPTPAMALNDAVENYI